MPTSSSEPSKQPAFPKAKQKPLQRPSEAHLEADLATKTDVRELEYRLIIKLGAMMMAAIAVVATLVKLR